jgi:hypothetical protein
MEEDKDKAYIFLINKSIFYTPGKQLHKPASLRAMFIDSQNSPGIIMPETFLHCQGGNPPICDNVTLVC